MRAMFGYNFLATRGDNSKDYWLTYTCEQKNLAVRLTASSRRSRN
jgi:hypothetical protein